MAVFHLECSIHRQSVSGLSVAYEQIVARQEAAAIAGAQARFEQLLANRSGCAVLKDEAGRTIWSARRPGDPQVTAQGA